MAGRGIGRRGAGPGRRRVRLGRCGGPGRLHVLGAAARRGQADRHGVRGDALLDQHGDGRAGGRGPLDGDGRAAAGSGPGERQAVRGPDVDRQPGLLRPPAGPPGHVAAGQRPARGRIRERRGRRQGRARDRLPAGRARADELPADQPGRAQADVRDRRGQPGRRDQPLRRRRAQQQRPAAPGRHPAVPGRREPRRHPGQGRVQERPDGAHPVRAADAQGPRDPGAGQPAVDQQVLRHGPGARAAASWSGRSSTSAPCSRSPTATRTPPWAARPWTTTSSTARGRRSTSSPRSPAHPRSTSSACAWAAR